MTRPPHGAGRGLPAGPGGRAGRGFFAGSRGPGRGRQAWGRLAGMRDFRFSCNVFAIRSQAEFTGYAVAAEEAGYDVVFTTDHLGSPAPFPPLVAAAAATRQLRVGTLVLNAGFWNPHLLAREVATVDLLTGGRLELGLGAGHMKWEYDAAGIAWPSFGERAGRLATILDEMDRLSGSDGYPEGAPGREFFGLPVQAPVQRRADGRPGPPLIIGGTGDRVLALAARRADTVALAGAVQVPGQPFLLIGTIDEIADLLRERRERYGFSFITVHEPFMRAFAPVIERVRAG
jgi:Luciferase-like monooxygenase